MVSKYLTRLIIFFGIYLVIAIVIRLIAPTYLGNAQFTEKMKVFKTMHEDINTVFLGNSTVYRHLNPEVFDKNTIDSTHTFNLGCDATPFMERTFLLEYLLSNYELERIIILTGHSADIREVNMHTLRSSYYHDFKRMMYGIKYRYDKTNQKLKHLLSYFENMLAMFRFQPMLEYYFTNKEPHADIYSKRGFLAYDVEVGQGETQNRGYVMNSHKYMAPLQKAISKQDFSRYKLTKKDKIIIEECNRIKKLGDQHSTEIIFLFPPNSALYYHYDLENKLYMGDGNEFKSFYDFKNRWNPGHLNSKGADLYSMQLAIKFNKYQKSK